VLSFHILIVLVPGLHLVNISNCVFTERGAVEAGENVLDAFHNVLWHRSVVALGPTAIVHFHHELLDDYLMP
jgi:hypothetical protein